MYELNIAAFASRTRALGPGLRAAVWVQGCPLNCRGCLAPDWIPFAPATRMTPAEILDKLDVDHVSGLTFSGGEPMEQAGGLAALARLAREQKDLDLICFTGYRYERLVEDPPNPGVPLLLAEVDLLIDGPFVQGLNNGVGLRGSSNQRMIHLSRRLKDCDLENSSRRVEITVRDGELQFIGIPTPGILAAVKSMYEDPERKEQDERA